MATDPEALSAQVYLPEREGSLQVELLAAVRRHGRIPFQLEPRADALLAEVAHGRPVLVLQNLRLRSLPAWHYAVLVGYDTQRNALQLNSGPDQGAWVEAPRFMRSWDWAGRWAMVALRPGELPAGLVAAADWYVRGLARNPYDPALANNLAAVLGETGCARAGEAVLSPVAGRLDGASAWRAAIEATLRDLALSKGPDPAFCAASMFRTRS